MPRWMQQNAGFAYGMSALFVAGLGSVDLWRGLVAASLLGLALSDTRHEARQEIRRAAAKRAQALLDDWTRLHNERDHP